MGKSLKQIANELKQRSKNVQLIYAFNGIGKTRLSREFKELVSPKKDNEEDAETQQKILYYNAFTEDLFYWDNDLEEDTNRKLMIRPNSFTRWVLDTLFGTDPLGDKFCVIHPLWSESYINDLVKKLDPSCKRLSVFDISTSNIL
jgi:hypothetical protein